jgi:hypothetical protein
MAGETGNIGRGHRGRKMPETQRARVAEGVRRWHASKTPEEREAFVSAQKAAQPKGLTLDRRLTKRTPFTRGHRDMSTPEGIAKMTRTKRMERLLVDEAVKAAQIVGAEERIQKLIEDVLNGPASVALAAWLKLGELQMKRREARPSAVERQPWVAYASDEELATVAAIAERCEQRMRAGEQPAPSSRPMLPPAPLDEPDVMVLP